MAVQSGLTASKNNGFDRVGRAVANILDFVVHLPLLPFVFLAESPKWVRHKTNLDQFKREQRRSRYELRQHSRLAVEFVNVYLRRQEELWERFLSTPWQSKAEARVGYEILRIAEAALMAEAQASARDLVSRR